MGASSESFPVSPPLKNHHQDKNSSYGCLWRKVVAGKGMKQKKLIMKRRPRMMMEGSRRRGAMRMKTRIRTLKRLIPRRNNVPLGLDGLFRDTAHYILSLQTRVRVMQIMVDVLTAPHD